MIFFAFGQVGLNLVKFIFKNFKQDIKAIVISRSDKLIKNYLKKKIPRSKILIWSKEVNFEKKLSSLNVDKFFLLWWPYILKKKILKIPKKGTINIHPSFLPYFKGKDPNFWSILKKGPYGVSIHEANVKVDSGKILFQKELFKINYTVDAEALYKIQCFEIVKLFKNKYKQLRLDNHKKFKMANKKTKINKRKDMLKESKINLNKMYKAEYLINLLRAKNFPPNNGVTFKKHGKTYSINIKIKEI